MFSPNLSLFAALILSSPAQPKEVIDQSGDQADLGARLERAKLTIAAIAKPLEYGGVVRDEARPFGVRWGNWNNWRNFNWNNWRNFANNWNNFRNSWNNWRNAPVI